MTTHEGAPAPEEATSIPLFPLGAVVVPGSTLPLRIFERRYREMVADLQARRPSERIFGVVGIYKGHEVGVGRAEEIYDVGSLVRLDRVVPEGGMLAVSGTAVGRFAIVAVRRRHHSYTRADVRPLPDVVVDADLVNERADAVRSAYRTYARMIGLGGTVDGLDPLQLPYTLIDRLPLTMADAQRVLEAPTCDDQLDLLTQILRREIAIAGRFGAVSLRANPGGAALN